MNEDIIDQAMADLRKAELETDLALQDLRQTIAEVLEKLEDIKKI